MLNLPSAMQELPQIYQIYYHPEQVCYLDPLFLPYDNSDDNDPLLEFNVFRKIERSGDVDGCRLWGALSWKFKQKTGMTGDELHQFIEANPGYDVYYCNPHVHLEAIFPNLWIQGETAHPNFLRLSRTIFYVLGFPPSWLYAVYPTKAFASTNYIIATPSFWRAYITFVENALERLHCELSLDELGQLFSSAADHKGFHAGASYLPFVVERLFACFMLQEGQNYYSIKYPLPRQEAKLDQHQILLRQMKDQACKDHSLWMLACWVNYRNLYLLTHFKHNWIERYIHIMTPNPPEFIEFP